MGRASVNVQDLTMWRMISDTENGVTYEDNARRFLDQLNSMRYTPSVQTAQQYGDGKKVEDYVAKDGGTIEPVIRAYSDGDNEFLFGATKYSDGVEVSNKDDIVPYVCVAYRTKRADGKYNLYKFPKVKFMPQGEDSKQQEGSAVQFGTASLSGTYSPLIFNGDDCYKKIGVDPDKDAKFIEKWFASALYETSVAPQEVEAVAGNASVTLSWKAINGAKQYRIERENLSTGAKDIAGYSAITTFVDKGLTNGTEYCYYVYAQVNDAWGDEAGMVWVTPIAPIEAPVISSINASAGSVSLSWNEVPDATSYRIYRADSAGGAKTLLKVIAPTTYTDTDVEADKTYYYFVAAYNSNKSELSDFSEPVSATTSVE